jgi:hypothetical protein
VLTGSPDLNTPVTTDTVPQESNDERTVRPLNGILAQ